MKYKISYSNPHQHFIDLEFVADKINSEITRIQLPAWRPGRYELGNFAKNVQKWAAFDEKGNALPFKKITKDCWEVNTKGVSQMHIKYNYYAAEINAGSTFLDATQLYMNPVNCCVYIPERINEKCSIEINVPADYIIAGLKSFDFKNFHDLADSPFIASATIQHNQFVCEGREFNLWFQGECKLDWSKLNTDFIKFCNHQIEMMKNVPFDSYHFLFQILPNKIYHGVEHTNSTVIALGPGYNLMKGDLYEDLLGVSCHELYHAWNIKTIRPIEMFPYDYTKENYSKLGYVCEGITTYYGDYLLFRSDVFTEEQYWGTLNERLQTHYDNFGRNYLSVADSSFDTWLDGYVPGIPNRKSNIYVEGNILAFVTDMLVRKNTNNEKSLDDVMRTLYEDFALKNKGYSDVDYKKIVELHASVSYDDIFNNYINGTKAYEPLIMDALNYIGCEMIKQSATKFNEHALGMKVNGVDGICKVTAVYPDSVADKAGIAVNDDVLILNEMQIKPDSSGTNFTEWSNYFGNVEQTITFATAGITKQAKLIPMPNVYYKTIKVQKLSSANESQKKNFEFWAMKKF